MTTRIKSPHETEQKGRHERAKRMRRDHKTYLRTHFTAAQREQMRINRLETYPIMGDFDHE